MATSHHPHDEATPPEEVDAQQAELFAASAAERAITDRKEPSDSAPLHHLTVSAEQSSLDNAQTLQPDSDSQEQTDRVLSKEELVEEALNCPCIASMRDGPCGDSFIAAYRCFLESETDPKGMDCMDQFKGMQACIAEHPEDYNLDDDDDADPFVAQKNPPPQDSHMLSSTSTAESPEKTGSNPTTPPSSASS